MKYDETLKHKETNNLLDAVKEGDIRLVRKSISKGANLNGNDYETPLGIAVQQQNRMLVRFLLTQGADVNKPHQQQKPLIHAIQTQNAEITDELLRKGANPNETFGLNPSWDKYQVMIKTPLILAVETGAFEVAQTLVKHGANPMKFVWNNENAFVTASDCNRGPEWISMLKKSIARPISHQNVELAKRTIEEVRHRQNG